jgi:hypothetical protein
MNQRLGVAIFFILAFILVPIGHSALGASMGTKPPPIK